MEISREKFQYPPHLISILCRISKNFIVTATLIVRSFDRFAGVSQFCLKFPGHRNVCDCCATIFWAVRRSVQDQDRCLYLRYNLRELRRIASGVEHDSLHIPLLQEVIEGRSGTAWVSKQSRLLWLNIRQ